MIRHHEYTRARFAQTVERLLALVYADTAAPEELLVAGPVDRISWEEAQSLSYRAVEVGERFGPLWATFWFRGNEPFANFTVEEDKMQVPKVDFGTSTKQGG